MQLAKDRTLSILSYLVKLKSLMTVSISFFVLPFAPSFNKFNPYFIERGLYIRFCLLLSNFRKLMSKSLLEFKYSILGLLLFSVISEIFSSGIL